MSWGREPLATLLPFQRQAVVSKFELTTKKTYC
jgi:hypothetical protein